MSSWPQFKKRVILISGKQGSGKSTLARELTTYLNAPLLKFAGPLYEMHEALRKVAKKYKIPFDAKEGRLLQVLGTDWGRTVKGADVWVNACKAAVDQALLGSPFVVIDDCRFPNEVEAFGKGALKVRLEASKDVRRARADGWREIEHESETALDEYTKWSLRFETGPGGITPFQAARWVISELGATDYVANLWGKRWETEQMEASR